jgi:hypothetical protein
MVRCGYGCDPYPSRMIQNDTRFEFKLPAHRRAELDSLADEAGLTASDLVRLAIRRLLEERNAILQLQAAAMTNAETWGELGPAMKKLNQRQQDFVRALVLEKPGYGALVNAYRKAGYGRTDSKRSTLSKDAHHLSRDSRIIEAVAEQSKKVLRLGQSAAVNEALALVMDVSHKHHARAVFALLDGADPATTKHSVDVLHRVEDPDRVARPRGQDCEVGAPPTFPSSE